MDSKEIKMEILSNKINEKKMNTYLKKDFKSTIQALFNALFVLLREPIKNQNKINNCLSYMNEVITLTDDKNKLTIICKKIEDVLTRIDKHLKKKNNSEVKEVVTSLKDLLMQIKNKSINKEKNDTTELLRMLIYEEKDLTKLQLIFEKQADILNCVSRKEIFKEILIEYISLEETDQQAIYYFNLISIILSSNNRKHIIYEKDEYIQILNKAKRKTKSIQAIKNKFNKEYSVMLSELEMRYKIKINYPNCEGYTEVNMQNKKNHIYDFIKYPSISIDEEGTSCIDDAIYLGKNSDGSYTLRIDIASVPNLIDYNSQLNFEAYRKTETIYTRDFAISIYPDYIAYDKGSLLENNVKYVISFIYQVDSNFDVIEDSLKIVNAKTVVSNNLSFCQANTLLKSENSNYLSDMLKRLSFIASKLEGNSNGVSIINSELIVAKFMKLVSRNISSYCKKEGIPFAYRVYEKLTEEKRRKLLSRYKTFSCSRVSNELIKLIEQKSEVGFYSSNPIEHQALGLKTYARITTPLRSYPATLNEYIIFDIIIRNMKDNKTYDKWNEILKQAIPYMNDRIKLNDLFIKEYEQLNAKSRILRR